ncbi:hypothetical protein GCM10022254_28870 [Actinomadura meridiana]|uniref:DUF3558 domain-containing protein n=1 Tax=Actinomadura meridiana TaxID=559626 RepID=A0ABP8C0N1_9ACTN
MGRGRPVEPFHRPYSPPEPPAPARRPKRFVPLAVVAVLAVAGAALYLLVPGRDDQDAAVRSVPGGAGGRPPTSDRSAPARARIVETLPPPCGMVSQATVDRVVPKATRRENANSTLSTCTYASAGSYPWLRVEAHLYAPADTPTPVEDAESYYNAQWAQAGDAPFVRTVTLERQRGIGDEAYGWSRADKGSPTVVGQLTARVRNAVFTVSYSERAPGDRGAQDGRARACLGTVTAVAREVLTALTHF